MRRNNFTRKKALLIGVSEYDFNDSLKFCRNDGEEISKILTGLGYEISHKLIGYVEWNVMRDTIIDFFSDRDVKLNDTLLFYYSGHGIPDMDGEVYISTSQTDRDMPEKRGFSLDDLTKLIQKNISTRIVVLLDCCYSGVARISKGIGKDDATMLQTSISKALDISYEGEGRCILAACQGLQEAFALEEQNHSLFTYYLLEGLRGNKSSVDDRGYVTADSLGKYVYNSIMSLPSERRPKQKPIRKIEASGDIVLAYYPQFARISIDNHSLRPNITSIGALEIPPKKYSKPRKLPKNIPSLSDIVYEERITEPLVIDTALPVNVTYENVIAIGLANPTALTISKTTLSFDPYYVFDYELYTARIDRSGKYHQIKDEGTSIVDALYGKIINEKNVLISKSYFRNFFSKMPQKPPDTEEVLKDIEDIHVIRDLTNIKPEFRYKAQRSLSYSLEVLSQSADQSS